jgi:hypothetical protein
MSQIPFIPDPIALDCAKKAGLPSWYVNDPMIKPAVALDPKKEKDYADCYTNKIKSPQKQTKQLLFILGGLVIGYYAYKKFNK